MRLADRIAQCRYAVRRPELDERRLDAPERRRRLRADISRVSDPICPQRRIDPAVHRAGVFQGRAAVWRARICCGCRRSACGSNGATPPGCRNCSSTDSSRLPNMSGARAAAARFMRSSPDGRRGCIRTFWSTRRERSYDLLASSMEAYFDLDTEEGEEPEPPDDRIVAGRCVFPTPANQRCGYLAPLFSLPLRAHLGRVLSARQADVRSRSSLARHALGTMAADIPVLLAFFLLLSTRTGLPQRTPALERLNRSRRARRQGSVARAHRSAVAGAARVPFGRRRRGQAIAGALRGCIMCADIWCGAAASFLAGAAPARQCAFGSRPHPHGHVDDRAGVKCWQFNCTRSTPRYSLISSR